MCPNLAGLYIYKPADINFILKKIRTFPKAVAKVVPNLELFFPPWFARDLLVWVRYVTETANQDLLYRFPSLRKESHKKWIRKYLKSL